MKKNTNLVGIFIGLLFLGLAGFIVKLVYNLLMNPSKDYQNVTVFNYSLLGALVFGVAGIFFIVQSLKGKSITTIGKTDVSKFAGAKREDTIGSYFRNKVLPGIGLMLLVTLITMIILFFIFNAVSPN